MAIFIGQLVGFALIVFIVWRYAVPPVRRMMANQQETVRKQLADSAEAKKRLAEAEEAHEKAVEQAKAEAKQVTEEALADAQRLVEQLHAQADAEVERIKCKVPSRFSFCVPSWFANCVRTWVPSLSAARAHSSTNTCRIPMRSRPPSIGSSTSSTRWHRRKR